MFELLTRFSKNSEHNAFYQIIDAMPDIAQRRKSIPLVTELVSYKS